MKDSRGKAVLIVIIILIIVVGGATGAYFYLRKIGKIGSLANTIATLNPNCKYNDPDLCKFVNGWKDLNNYKINDTSTDKDGKKTTGLIEIDGTTKTHIIGYDSTGKELYNWMTIDKVTFAKDYTDNKWWKQSATDSTNQAIDTSESQFKPDFTGKASDTEDKTTYKKIGTEACGSLQCFKYQVLDPSSTETEYIYFDNKDYQLRKSYYQSTDGSTMLDEITYNGIKISEPTPTKDATQQQNIIFPQTNSSP